MAKKQIYNTLEEEFFRKRFKRDPKYDEHYFKEWQTRIARAKMMGIEDLSGIADSDSMRILKKLLKKRGWN